MTDIVFVKIYCSSSNIFYIWPHSHRWRLPNEAQTHRKKESGTRRFISCNWNHLGPLFPALMKLRHCCLVMYTSQNWQFISTTNLMKMSEKDRQWFSRYLQTTAQKEFIVKMNNIKPLYWVWLIANKQTKNSASFQLTTIFYITEINDLVWKKIIKIPDHCNCQHYWFISFFGTIHLICSHSHSTLPMPPASLA